MPLLWVVEQSIISIGDFEGLAGKWHSVCGSECIQIRNAEETVYDGRSGAIVVFGVIRFAIAIRILFFGVGCFELKDVTILSGRLLGYPQIIGVDRKVIC